MPAAGCTGWRWAAISPDRPPELDAGSESTATSPAFWLHSRSTGLTSSCRLPRRSCRCCSLSAAGQSRCAESTAQLPPQRIRLRRAPGCSGTLQRSGCDRSVGAATVAMGDAAPADRPGLIATLGIGVGRQAAALEPLHQGEGHGDGGGDVGHRSRRRSGGSLMGSPEPAQGAAFLQGLGGSWATSCSSCASNQAR
jgi:hypothetical protein